VLSSSSPDFICFKSKTKKWKISIHIIITNCKILKKDNGNFVKDINSYARSCVGDLNYQDYIILKPNTFFDESIYDRNRKLRAWNSSKPNENRKMIIVEGILGRNSSLGY